MDNLEGAESFSEYTRGEPGCSVCGDSGWVHSPNSPDHPCPKCLSSSLRGMKSQHLYTSSVNSKLMPELQEA